MILGTDMQPFENILYEEDERAITGFINSSGELEYSVYKQVDGGCLDLEDNECNKDRVLELLQIELDSFAKRNVSSLCILGHDICVKLVNGKYVSKEKLDEEVYEISHSIMQGEDSGDIFLESLRVKAYWNVIR